MKKSRIISLLMAALSSTSSLMATKGNLNLDQNQGEYTKQSLNENGRRRRKLRVRNSEKQEALNLPSSDGSFKDTKASVVQSNQNNKAKEMLYGAGKWVKNNPGQAIGYGLLGAVGTDMLWRGGNEFIRLPIIYKTPENAKKFKAGMGASNVVEVVRRFGDSNKKLVKKQIARFTSTGYQMGDFDHEALACKMLSKWSKEDENEKIFEHIAKVVNYHYGLGNLYVTYEEADGVDWEKQGIKRWNEKEKLNWLHKVCKQVIDVALFFQSKGYYHGDLHDGNYTISGTKDDPQVNVFDFGRFYKVKKKGENKLLWTPAWDLKQILDGFVVLAVKIGLSDYVPPEGSFLYEVVETRKKNNQDLKTERNRDKQVTYTKDYLSSGEFCEKLSDLKKMIDGNNK